MFDWLGLSPSIVQILGCVFIVLACLLLVFVIVIMIKSLKELRKEKEQFVSENKKTEQKENKTETKDNAKEEPKNVEIVENKIVDEKVKDENVQEQPKPINLYLKKLKKLTDEEKESYTILKNTLLNYSDLKNTLTVDGETYKYNNRIIGAITIKNNTLKTYLKLSKKDLDQRFNNEASEYKKYQKTPMEFVINKDVELRKAKKSIEDLAEELELVHTENYKERTFATLIKKFD